MLLMFSVEVPVLVSVTCLAGLVAPTRDKYDRALGTSFTCPMVSVMLADADLVVSSVWAFGSNRRKELTEAETACSMTAAKLDAPELNTEVAEIVTGRSAGGGVGGAV